MNPLESLIQQLSQQAGPRGATFAGRVIPQGQTPSLKELMTRPPQESPDAEGLGTLAAGGALISRGKTLIPEMVNDVSSSSSFRALNNEISALEKQAMAKGFTPEQKWQMTQGIAKTLDQAREAGQQLPQDAHAQMYAESLKRLLAIPSK